MIESAKDTIFLCIADNYVHFTRIQPLDIVDSGSLDGKLINILEIWKKYSNTIRTF